jgi:hypothetical protein
MATTQKIVSGPVPLDWTGVYSGDANTEVFEIVGGDDPIDITGSLIEAQARVSATDDTIALTAVVELTAPTLGQFTISWPGEDVRTLLAGSESWSGVWDVQFTAPGETLPTTLLRGRFDAAADVTRTEVTP